MWTDGSKLEQGNVSAAVGWRDKKFNQWKIKSIFLGKNEVLDAELWAILEALKVVGKETINMRDTPITIFSDSQKALTAIQHLSSSKENGFLRGLIYSEAKELNENRDLITLWGSPSHSGLVGMKRPT